MCAGGLGQLKKRGSIRTETENRNIVRNKEVVVGFCFVCLLICFYSSEIILASLAHSQNSGKQTIG